MTTRSIEIAVFFNGKWNDRLMSSCRFTTDIDATPKDIRDSVRTTVDSLLDGVSDDFLTGQYNQKGG